MRIYELCQALDNIDSVEIINDMSRRQRRGDVDDHDNDDEQCVSRH